MMKVALVLLSLVLQYLPLVSFGFNVPQQHDSTPSRLAPARTRKRAHNVPVRPSSIFQADHHRDGGARPNKRSLLTLQKATSNNESGDERRRRRFTLNPIKFVKAVVSGTKLSASKSITNFKSLSKKGKRIVVTRLVLFVFAFGILARKVSHVSSYSPGGRPPVEVAYSSFMDLVEQQGGGDNNARASTSNSLSSGSRSATIGNVRIAPDKITYRIYTNDGSASSSTSSDGVDNKAASSKPSTKQQEQEQVQVQVQQQQQQRSLAAYTRKVHASPELIGFLRENNLPFTAASQKRTNAVALTMRYSILGFYCFFLWKMYKAMSNQTGNKDIPGKLASSSTLPMASFRDIQGIDDAKGEVMELVDTLRNPRKYSILGARAPTGLLLEGPPGTGKTMLARATAATAGVPLLYCSGSDFVEMFVGRGAARIRRLFERATKLAPCIIFIDELDTLGKARDYGGNGIPGMSSFRSNDEAEQTLNQLLSCMDGLDSSRRICVLAATNRKDVLDPALIRPGRFDRIIKLKLPDLQGREKILRVHASKLPGFQEGVGIEPTRQGSLGKGNKVDLSAVAAVTTGFSGAELEFVVNEAAIRAVRRVSAQLMKQQGDGTMNNSQSNNNQQVIPQVLPEDFETSVTNFYETRKPKSNVGDIWKAFGGSGL